MTKAARKAEGRMGRAKALLWDNDGILVDTEPLYMGVTREIMAEVGVGLSIDEFREVSLERGQSCFELVRAAGFERGLRAMHIELPSSADYRQACMMRVFVGVEILFSTSPRSLTVFLRYLYSDAISIPSYIAVPPPSSKELITFAILGSLAGVADNTTFASVSNATILTKSFDDKELTA